MRHRVVEMIAEMCEILKAYDLDERDIKIIEKDFKEIDMIVEFLEERARCTE